MNLLLDLVDKFVSVPFHFALVGVTQQRPVLGDGCPLAQRSIGVGSRGETLQCPHLERLQREQENNYIYI